MISHFFDVAITNSWVQYKCDCKALNIAVKDTEQYLDFRLHLAEELLDRSEDDGGSDNSLGYEPPTQRRLPQPERSVRRRGAVHMPEMMDVKHAQRCRKKGCKSKTYMRCTKCKMYLCIAKKRNCFKDYHRKK